jgi:hypothetical protein
LILEDYNMGSNHKDFSKIKCGLDLLSTFIIMLIGNPILNNRHILFQECILFKDAFFDKISKEI